MGVVLVVELVAGCDVEEQVGVHHIEPLVLWVEIVEGMGGIWVAAADFLKNIVNSW
jgi:hypothetical protein